MQEPQQNSATIPPAREACKARVRRLAEGKRAGEITHVPTGLGSYDAKFGGMELGCATLVLAHTGEGKSSLVRQCMVGAAEAGVPSLDFSLEDPESKTLDRILSNRSGVPSKSLNSLELAKGDLPRLQQVAATLPDDYYLDHRACRSSDLLARLRHWTKERRQAGYRGPLCCAVDYLQKVEATEELLGELGSQVANWAKEEDSAALCASQVRSEATISARNRFAAAKPPSSKPANWQDFIAYFQPQPGDAKFCRRLEESAKSVWAYFRPGRWAKDFAGWDVQDNFAELHVIKSNFNETGYATLGWDGATQRIFQR